MWLALLIIATIAVILVLVGFFMRRRQFAYIDDLEIRKIDLMSRPVIEEVSRVKDLNLDGETEESFAGWRKRWDVMLSISFPEVELLFFDAEENADTFHFAKVRYLGAMITARLDEIEKSIDQIFSEIDTLMKTASKNEDRLEGLKERFKELKKYIIVYNHSFGKSLTAMERAIERCMEQFPIVDTKLTTGDYFSASELLDDLEAKHDTLIEKSILIPKLYEEANKKLPDTLTILMQTYHDMKNEGYPLQNLKFEKRHAQMKQTISVLLDILSSAEAFQAQEIIQELQGTINLVCEQLETEEKSKAYILEQRHRIDDNMKLLVEQIKVISEDTTKSLAAYRLQTEDLLMKKKLEDDIVFLQEKWTVIRKGFLERTKPFSEIKTRLVEVENAIDEYLVIQKQYSGRLLALSQDEIYARTKIVNLRETVKDVSYAIKMANLPGVPEAFAAYLAEVKVAVTTVDENLEDVPLDMNLILALLSEAKDKVGTLKVQSEKIICDADLVEKVILYGNRHRLKYPAVADALNEAEIHFKLCKYSEALAIASGAIEKIDSRFYENLEVVQVQAKEDEALPIKLSETDDQDQIESAQHAADADHVEKADSKKTEENVNDSPSQLVSSSIKADDADDKPSLSNQQTAKKNSDRVLTPITPVKKEATEKDEPVVITTSEQLAVTEQPVASVPFKSSVMSLWRKVKEATASFVASDDEDEDNALLEQAKDAQSQALSEQASSEEFTNSNRDRTRRLDDFQLKSGLSESALDETKRQKEHVEQMGSLESKLDRKSDRDQLSPGMATSRRNDERVTGNPENERPSRKKNRPHGEKNTNQVQSQKSPAPDLEQIARSRRASNATESSHQHDKSAPVSGGNQNEIDQLAADADAALGKIFKENKAYTTFSSVNEVNEFYDAELTRQASDSHQTGNKVEKK